MSTKLDVLRDDNSCLNKADIYEPLFVLRAHDPQAPNAVFAWCKAAIGHHEPDKIREACLVALEMERWRLENVREALPVHDPDKYLVREG